MVLHGTPGNDDLGEPTTFWWATGIEDTFITAPWPKTGRTLDEYELTLHYQRWKEDIDLASQLGVQFVRYGVPWHRINPSQTKWDWRWTDDALEYLLSLGVHPIVDLVHYGLPPWIEGAFLNPDFPHWMAEYAARLAERFKGRIHYYTPLNEPRITAWYCGRLGWWPPFLKGWSGFVRLMLSICRGIVRTVKRLHSVDPTIVPVHVDATDFFVTSDPSLQPEVNQRQEIVFLALDLITGRVNEGHTLHAWLLHRGAKEEDLAWFRDNALALPLVGINLYPMFSKKILLRTSSGIRIRMPYADASIVEQLGKLYWNRYRTPLMISETASEGSVKRRADWLESSVTAVHNLRKSGIPLVGYTWWPMFALVAWAYRQGTRPAASYIKQMGLWDLHSDSAGDLRRVSTPLVEQYQKLVSGGWKSVGLLHRRKK